MPRVLRPVDHDARLSLVEHLDELRTRLIVSIGTLFVAFGVCFWQNKRLLNILEHPVSKVLNAQYAKGEGLQGPAALATRAVIGLAGNTSRLAKALASPGSGLSASARRAVATLVPKIHHDVAHLHVAAHGQLATLSVGEPFTVTITVCLYFAVLLSMPVLLYQLYGFVLPAFSPRERAVAMPVLIAVPGLLVGGVAFGYFVVLPAATHFLLDFNSSKFDVIVQANSYYPFAALILFAMGLIFQVPVAVVAAQRAEIVTTRQLRKSRRIAIAVAAVIAALLPGDAVTMLLETLPIIVLYEISIHIAALLDRRDRRRAARFQAAGVASPAMATPPVPPPPPRDDAV
jgi:sec-independent protein translocase protein TatC